MSKENRSTFLLVAALALWLACAPDADTGQAEANPPPAADPPQMEVGAPDLALASEGAALFQSRGCIGCHTIGGGRLTGPDLQGVTERREADWVISMIANPDSMLKVDPEARKLFAEYMTPMLNVGLTRDQARAIYEYLRQPNQ